MTITLHMRRRLRAAKRSVRGRAIKGHKDYFLLTTGEVYNIKSGRRIQPTVSIKGHQVDYLELELEKEYHNMIVPDVPEEAKAIKGLPGYVYHLGEVYSVKLKKKVPKRGNSVVIRDGKNIKKSYRIAEIAHAVDKNYDIAEVVRKRKAVGVQRAGCGTDNRDTRQN